MIRTAIPFFHAEDTGWRSVFGGKRADQAFATAMEALTIVKAHVDECNRRENDRVRQESAFHSQYKDDVVALSKSIEEIHDRISAVGKNVNSMFWVGAGTFIVMLISAIVYLLIHGTPYQIVATK